jgi:hypothetical protein
MISELSIRLVRVNEHATVRALAGTVRGESNGTNTSLSVGEKVVPPLRIQIQKGGRLSLDSDDGQSIILDAEAQTEYCSLRFWSDIELFDVDQDLAGLRRLAQQFPGMDLPAAPISEDLIRAGVFLDRGAQQQQYVNEGFVFWRDRKRGFVVAVAAAWKPAILIRATELIREAVITRTAAEDVIRRVLGLS